MIWEITLQEIKFFISRNYFGTLTFSAMVSNVIRVELQSLILENRCQIHEIKYFLNVVIEEISGRENYWGDKRP